ncbi:hypothetical protein CGERO_05455 [Corynebacterium gerontici]|uniref:Uncharacterized protein n=1 Tax=Corynebacterium gerontici TaxID=2079234 RepID=A0A3G6J036_9CORY|nr:hypothetical protein CGERO_05455 [Corynebacterium gerontici]
MSERMLPALWLRIVGLTIFLVFIAFQKIWWLCALVVAFMVLTSIQLRQAYRNRNTSQ